MEAMLQDGGVHQVRYASGTLPRGCARSRAAQEFVDIASDMLFNWRGDAMAPLRTS